MKKYYPCTGTDKRAILLLDFLQDGTVYGTCILYLEKRRFYKDDHAGNFGTIEILRKVESLEEFEKGMFSGKSTISRRPEDLEQLA